MRRRDFLSFSAGLLPLWACRNFPPPAAQTRARSANDVVSGRLPCEGAPSAPSTFSQLTGYCAAVMPPDAAEFAARLGAVQSELNRLQFAGMVIEPGSNMRYLFGVQWGQSERPFLAFVPQSGVPIWMSPAFEERSAREQLGDSARVETWHEHENAYAALVEAMKLPKQALVAADVGMRGFVLDGLQRALGEARVRVADPVGACRIVKTEPELARLRRVNEATKAALAVAAQSLRPGMLEGEFADLVKQAQAAAGLDHIWALVLFGSNASFPHGTRHERPLAKDDLVLVDTGGFLHGYASDLTRTWTLGAVDGEQRRAWETVHAAQTAGLEQLIVGRTCATAEAAARERITRAGFGTGYELFTHRLGHGIGLDVHEHPYLVRGNETVLKPGMVMSNEPGIYVAGQFGVRLEDIVAITGSEPEVFGPRAVSLAKPFG